MKVAVVIFVIGEKYNETFNNFFKKSVEQYCNKYNYDLIILNDFLKKEQYIDRKKFYWQRLLIPKKFIQYDFVLSLDSDIYINENAPELPLAYIPEGKIAAINERKYLGNYEWREKIQIANKWEQTGKDWYKLSNEEKKYNDHINGGFVLYQPKYHGDLMEKLYNENINNYMKYHQDDQSFLSSYLIDNKMIYWLDERYNRVWFFWKEILYPLYNNFPENLKQILMYNYIELNYFCHFTSHIDIDILKQIQNNGFII
jgi:hypothetical protein